MKTYDRYAKFYDATQSAGMYDAYSQLIEQYAPHAKSLLELGCGTGLNLEKFRKTYEVTGIDYSEAMLEVATTRLPETPLFHQDMSELTLKDRFDVIICPYDSINHVLNFDSWVKTFQNSKEHLALDGVFIFDFNTLFQLDLLAVGAEFVKEFDNNYLIMDVQKTNELLFNWNINIFEDEGDAKYKLHTELIKEVSYDTDKVKEVLESLFKSVTIFGDGIKLQPTDSSKRVFCICS